MNQRRHNATGATHKWTGTGLVNYQFGDGSM
jgi:hypothetical protein